MRYSGYGSCKNAHHAHLHGRVCAEKIMHLAMPWQPPCVGRRQPQRNAAPFLWCFFVALLQGGQLRGLWGVARAAGIVVVRRGHHIFPQPLKGFASSNVCATQCATCCKIVVNVFMEYY